jgi:hypothetical protein
MSRKRLFPGAIRSVAVPRIQTNRHYDENTVSLSLDSSVSEHSGSRPLAGRGLPFGGFFESVVLRSR